MSTEHIPFIEAENYEAFRTLLPTLPASYAEWQAGQAGRLRECRSAAREVNEVRVRPDLFARWCDDRNEAPSLALLYRHAHAEGLPPDGRHRFDGTADPWGSATTELQQRR